RQRPVLTSISDAISSPTRCSSSSVPAAASFSSSKRFVSSSVSGSRSANSSSTATVRSSAFSKASRANAICSSGARRCASPTRLSYLKGREQPFGDALPAPPLDSSAPCCCPERRGFFRRQRRERPHLPRQVHGVTGAEARKVAELFRILGLETFGDLRENRMPCNERRRTCSRRFCGDHPERLREDRRDDGDVRKRKQVAKVTVLEWPREERARQRDPLELLAVVAEPDDHCARVDRAQSLKQDVDAFVVEQLPEVDDGRRVAGEERLEARCIVLVREPLVRFARV